MNKKILVLDDEQDYIQALKNFLKELKYNVKVTMFPKHALEIIEKDKPDVVLFDYKLPDMDGDEFFKKAAVLSRGTKYILITAYHDEATINRFRKMGVNEVILKPIDLEALLKAIQ